MMSKTRYQKEIEPDNPRPKGHPGCICGGSGMLSVMASLKFAGTTPWNPGERYWWRSHTVTVLCPCPVGQWIQERHQSGVNNRCPWQVYDHRTMILASVFELAYYKWSRGESDVVPVVTPQDVPVENLSASPLTGFDATSQWLSPAPGVQPELFGTEVAA